MGLPTCQLVVTCVPYRYCLISSGVVSASHIFAGGASMAIELLVMTSFGIGLSSVSFTGWLVKSIPF
jgi:hypothetical protein